jgi:hypothetical protein
MKCVALLMSGSRLVKVKMKHRQDNVSASLVFLMYVYDTDEVVMSRMLKFADGANLFWL